MQLAQVFDHDDDQPHVHFDWGAFNGKHLLPAVEMMKTISGREIIGLGAEVNPARFEQLAHMTKMYMAKNQQRVRQLCLTNIRGSANVSNFTQVAVLCADSHKFTSLEGIHTVYGYPGAPNPSHKQDHYLAFLAKVFRTSTMRAFAGVWCTPKTFASLPIAAKYKQQFYCIKLTGCRQGSTKATTFLWIKCQPFDSPVRAITLADNTDDYVRRLYNQAKADVNTRRLGFEVHYPSEKEAANNINRLGREFMLDVNLVDNFLQSTLFAWKTRVYSLQPRRAPRIYEGTYIGVSTTHDMELILWHDGKLKFLPTNTVMSTQDGESIDDRPARDAVQASLREWPRKRKSIRISELKERGSNDDDDDDDDESQTPDEKLDSQTPDKKL